MATTDSANGRFEATDFLIEFASQDHMTAIDRHNYLLHPRDPSVLQTGNPFSWQWQAGVFTKPSAAATLQQLETYQFTYRTDLPSSLTVRLSDENARPPAFIRLLIGSRQSGSPAMPADATLHNGVYCFDDLRPFWQQHQGAPRPAQHITLLAFMAGDDAARETGRRAMAVWLSPIIDSVPDEIDWQTDGRPPRWSLQQVEDALFLIYAGDLYYRLAEHQGPLRISIPPGDSEHPISSQYLAFRVDRNQHAAARTFVAQAGRGNHDINATYLGSANLPTDQQISITGHGRLNAEHLLARPDFSDRRFARLIRGREFVLQASCGEYRDASGELTTATFQQAAEYLIDSNIVSLASSSAANPALTLHGVTIANAPARHQASVNLNVVTTPMASLDELVRHDTNPASNNRPVNVADVKVVGNWVGAADGMEVGGDYSIIDQVYLHIADDAIKIAAKQMRFRHITVIQGDVGGVINIGSYGYNRGVAGTTLTGIYVHRVTHKLWQTGARDSQHEKQGEIAQDDDRGGLVTSRTGNFNFLGQGSDGLTDVTIKHLYVPRLRIDGEDLNSVARCVALGVMGGHRTSRSGFVSAWPPVSEFEFGGFVLQNLQIEPPAQAASLFYCDPIRRSHDDGPGEVTSGAIRLKRFAAGHGISVEFTAGEQHPLPLSDGFTEYNLDASFIRLITP